MATKGQIKTFDVYQCHRYGSLGGDEYFVAIERGHPNADEPPRTYMSHTVELAWSEEEAIGHARREHEAIRSAIRAALNEVL